MTASAFKGRIRDLRSIGGARLVTVSHRAGARIDAHDHDWPHLTIHLAGGCVEHSTEGSAIFNRPGAVFHPARSGHADDVFASGLETAGLVFDPAWLGAHSNRAFIERPFIRHGGRAALAASRLVRAWRSPASSDATLRETTQSFFMIAQAHEQASVPRWLHVVEAMLDQDRCKSTAAVARELDLHPAWLARRYRELTGEGIQQTTRRKHVERALLAIRASDVSLAEIAIDAGFCDQPHMNRCFRQVLGVTPTQYRHQESGSQPQRGQ